MYDACVPWPERPKGAKDKSRGPKGLELEVGARRAPKLLVFIYSLFFCIQIWPDTLAIGKGGSEVFKQKRSKNTKNFRF